MATSFFLRGSNPDQMHIWLRFRTDDIDVRLPVGNLLIRKAEWNDKAHAPRKVKNCDEPHEAFLNGIKIILNSIDKEIGKRLPEWRAENLDYKKCISNVISEITGGASASIKKEAKRKKVNYHRIDEFVTDYVAGMEDGSTKMIKSRDAYIYNTAKTWRTFDKIVKAFATHYKKSHRAFTWGCIDGSFRDSFVDWMKGEGYADSSINKVLSKLRTMVTISANMGYHSNALAKGALANIDNPDEGAGATYLTKTEIEALASMELQGRQDLVRDLFLIQCLSGQRVSDVKAIRREDIIVTEDGGHAWRVKQQKTGEIVEIELHGLLHQIFKKYDYNVPGLYEQAINKGIKIILKSLSESVPTLQNHADIRVKKGGKQTESKAKWERISNHTGRRSMCTNMRESGYSLEEVMSRSGHRNLATLDKYLKKTINEHSANVAKKQREAEKAAEADGKLLLY